ncbi:MAG: Ca-activated chloride channel [Blastocatellia bacterium]|jgi:VWFA-related protein|nr:Ca-activated chloride channel [Blastocatellia bacterium]
MPARQVKITLQGCLVCAVLALAVCFVADSAAQQDGTKQQQRPRKVGVTSTSPAATTTPTPSGTPPTNQTQTTSSGEDVDEGDVVRVETQLVTVPAVVTDRTGRPLAGLRAENFVVFEDGKPQRVTNFATTEAPFEIALLLDTSGSTRDELGLIRDAANAFINALRPGDRVGIVAFNNGPRKGSVTATVEVLSPLNSDRSALRAAIERLGTSNGTPFYDGLARVADQVFHDPPREEVRGRRAVVALTDGVDSSSDSGYDDARAKLARAGVASYFIQVNTEEYVEDRLLKDCQDDGRLTLSAKQLERFRQLFVPQAEKEDYQDFCRLGQFERMDISRQLYNLARKEMGELARASGGKAFVAGNLQETRAAFAQVANEIGTQYSLGYYPLNKIRDGRFRQIKVEMRGVKDSSVRAREGYFAPKQ